VPIQRDVLLFFYKQRPRHRPGAIRLDPRTLAFFGTILVLLGLAGWLYLTQSSQVARYAYEIRTLERQKERLHRELVALRGEIALAESLQRVQEAGAALGYVLPEAKDSSRRLRLEYQPPTPTPVAATPVPGGRPAGEGSTPQQGSGGWLQRLWAQFQTWLHTPVE